VLDRSWISLNALRRNAALSLEYFEKSRPKAAKNLKDGCNHDD
jgi:hypothetical protein